LGKAAPLKHLQDSPFTPALSLRERENYAKHFVFHFVIARRGGWSAQNNGNYFKYDLY